MSRKAVGLWPLVGLLIVWLTGVPSVSAQVLSFEEAALPASLSTSSAVRPSQEHAKYGQQSLRWDWQSGDILTFKQPIAFTKLTPEATSNALSTFVVWVYNPKARATAKLRFEFGRGKERDCWFEFGLDFTGWRTCWVAYERDMQGQPRVDMDTVRIVASAESGSGVFFIDSLVVSQPIDARHHTRDPQVPFVNTCLPTDANYHWLGLYRFNEQPVPNLPLPDGALDAARTIEKRYEQLIGEPAKTTPAVLAKLEKRYAEWEIRRTPEGVVGHPVAYPHESVAYPADSVEQAESGGKQGLQTCTNLLFDLAQACRGAADAGERARLSTMFLDLSDHLLDQGWAYGSSMGTVHHLGYNNRLYYPALFLMRDVLRSTGRLPEVQRAMAWLSGVGKAYGPLEQVNGVSIDTLNTTLQGQIGAQLLIDDEPLRARALLATARWFGRALEPSIGLNGGIKADGSILHHGNHYPAYAEGGIRGATQALWLFSNTPLRVPEAGHANLRRAMLNLRFQCNVLQWPLSLSGRHPTGEFTLNPVPHLFLALAGTPDGREPIDLEVASSWKRLATASGSPASPRRKVSADVGLYRRAVPAADDAETSYVPTMPLAIEPETPPTGHITLSYATTAAHRRAHWLATARGFSRYLWGAEIYPGANLFGRYIAYGHVELLAAGNPVNLFDSGYAEDGWDWNCWPGTTTIHLPLDLLRDKVNNVDIYSGFEEMLLSDESFAGGSNLGGRDGMFAMKLHEHGKYNGSHRARKSVFFFDDHLVLLGSNITNTDRHHDTRTTLFQHHLKKQMATIRINGEPSLAEFPSQFSGPARGASLVDTAGNTYYVLTDSALRVSKATQASRSQNDKRDTSGDFVLAWLDHGQAPVDAGYAYTILVQPTDARRSDFGTALARTDREPFAILRRDQAAHIVRDRDTGILALACFEPVEDTGLEVAAVDSPALVMLRTTQAGAALSVCDPDLHLYSGNEPDQLNPDGTQREVSVYSRTWYRSASAPSRVCVTLAGDYLVAKPDARVATIAAGPGRTILEFTCQDGLPVEVQLTSVTKTP